MSATITDRIESTPPDRTRGLLTDLGDCWRRLPNKELFLVLLAGWMALVQFLGSSTFGYVSTPSLLYWMFNAYTAPYTEDSQGVLIPLVVLVLFYQKRKVLFALPLRVWAPGLGILAVACLLHLSGYVVQQQRLSVAAFFLGIYGIMGVAWGPEFLRKSFFPFFLFGFCIPMGGMLTSVSFPLRVMVSQIVTMVGQVMGVDVIRDGTRLLGGEGRFEYDVAAACSGIRSLIATVAIATIYAFVAFRRPWKRLVLLVSAFPLAVIGNVFRMLIIVLAGEWRGQAAGAYVHESSFWGLLPYLPPIIGMLLLGRWMGEEEPAAATTAPGATA
jgi:exosortase